MRPAAEISAEALQRAEEMIEQEEGVQNKHAGWLAAFVTTVAVVMRSEEIGRAHV